jgi:hypothetical protein
MTDCKNSKFLRKQETLQDANVKKNEQTPHFKILGRMMSAYFEYRCELNLKYSYCGIHPLS